MIVYCEGPPDATHERFVVAHYRQYLFGNTLMWLPQQRFEHRGRRGHTHAVQRFIGPDGRPQANQDTPVRGRPDKPPAVLRRMRIRLEPAHRHRAGRARRDVRGVRHARGRRP